MPFLNGLMGKMMGFQPGQGLGDRLQGMAAFGQGAMGGRGLLGALGGGMQGAQQWQQAHPWAPPSAPTMQPFTPAQLPGQVAMPNIAPMAPGSVGQMPPGQPTFMPGMPGQMPRMSWPPQGQQLGFNSGWRL